MAPAAIGPYSQAVRTDSMLFISGQISIDATNQKVELFDGSVTKQCHQIFKNLEAILVAAGLDFKAVVKTTVYLTSMHDFTEMNQVYAHYFANHRPARATIAVSALPGNVAVEIDAIACYS